VTRHPPAYRAYLLRVWTPAGDGDVRASIRDVETGETHAFTDLDQLTEWLRGEVRTSPVPASPASPTGNIARRRLPPEP
jgi:hypothetical protein